MPEDKPESTNTDAPVTAAPSTDENMVELHKASLEDIDAEIARATAEEGVIVGAEASATDDTLVSDPQTPGQESGAQASDNVARPGAEPSKPAAAAAPRVYTQEEVQGLLAEKERLKQEGNQKELFIQHRNNELGQVRQNLAKKEQDLMAVRSQLETGLEDRFRENPLQASKDQKKIEEIDSLIEGLKGQEERATRIAESQTFFLRNVDIEKVTLDDVAAVLKELDGLDDNAIAAFKTNPWEWTTPEALVQMGKRAMDRKEFVTADSDRRILAKYCKSLQEENARLKARPGQVMNQVQRHLNQSPALTAASSSAPRPELDPTAIPRMSNAELDAALKHAMRQ